MSWPRLGAAFLLCALCAACASRAPRVFSPVTAEQVRAALEAWKIAVTRASALPAARLLYDSRVSQGLFRSAGTLAVREGPGVFEATLTGPFGSPIARYSEGALRGEGFKPVAIAPGEMRSFLAGVWKEDSPVVEGMDGADALLSWRSAGRVEGVLDVSAARFKSLEITRREGKLRATYSGNADPWPERIELEDRGSGGKLALTLIAVE